MNGVRYVVLDGSRRIELVNVLAISDDGLSVCDVHISRHLVDVHCSADAAALVSTHCGEVTGSVAQALSGVAQDVHDGPLLHLVVLDQLVAGVAALDRLGLGTEAGAAVVCGQGNLRKRTLEEEGITEFTEWSTSPALTSPIISIPGLPIGTPLAEILCFIMSCSTFS